MSILGALLETLLNKRWNTDYSKIKIWTGVDIEKAKGEYESMLSDIEENKKEKSNRKEEE